MNGRCPPPEALLEAIGRGSGEALGHVETCSECSEMLEEALAVVDLLRDDPGEWSPGRLPGRGLERGSWSLAGVALIVAALGLASGLFKLEPIQDVGGAGLRGGGGVAMLEASVARTDDSWVFRSRAVTRATVYEVELISVADERTQSFQEPLPEITVSAEQVGDHGEEMVFWQLRALREGIVLAESAPRLLPSARHRDRRP